MHNWSECWWLNGEVTPHPRVWERANENVMCVCAFHRKNVHLHCKPTIYSSLMITSQVNNLSQRNDPFTLVLLQLFHLYSQLDQHSFLGLLHVLRGAGLVTDNRRRDENLTEYKYKTLSTRLWQWNMSEVCSAEQIIQSRLTHILKALYLHSHHQAFTLAVRSTTRLLVIYQNLCGTGLVTNDCNLQPTVLQGERKYPLLRFASEQKWKTKTYGKMCYIIPRFSFFSCSTVAVRSLTAVSCFFHQGLSHAWLVTDVDELLGLVLNQNEDTPEAFTLLIFQWFYIFYVYIDSIYFK